MFLAEVDISKTACFMTTQTFSQEVTKFIPCDDVTRFDGTVFPIQFRKRFDPDSRYLFRFWSGSRSLKNSAKM